MKYIDADKLKRFVGELKERAKRNRCDSWGIVPDALEEVEGFIDSLQQEQPEVDIVPLQEERMGRYINYCLQREDDECHCPTCGKYVTGLRLFPYYYDRKNNDVYLASVCPECGKIIISKE